MPLVRQLARKLLLITVPVVTTFTLVTPQIAHAAVTPSITESTPQLFENGAIINYTASNLPTVAAYTPNEYIFAKVECLDGTSAAACSNTGSITSLAPDFSNSNGYTPINTLANGYAWSTTTSTNAAPFSVTSYYPGMMTTLSTYNSSFFIDNLVAGQRYKVTLWLSANTLGTTVVGTTTSQTFTSGTGAVSGVTFSAAGQATGYGGGNICVLGCNYYYGSVVSGSKATVRWTPSTANSVTYYSYPAGDPKTAPAPSVTYTAVGYQVEVVPSWEAGSSFQSTTSSQIIVAAGDTPKNILANYALYGQSGYGYSPNLQTTVDGCVANNYAYGSSVGTPQTGWYVDGINTSSVTLDGCHFAKDETYVAYVQPVYMPASLIAEAKAMPSVPTSWNQITGVFPMAVLFQLYTYTGYNTSNSLAGSFFPSAKSAAVKADGTAGSLPPDLGTVTNVTAVPASTTDHTQKGTLKVSWTAPTRDLYWNDLSASFLNAFQCGQTSPPYYVTSVCGALGYSRYTSLPYSYGVPNFTATAPISYKVTAYRTDTSPWFGYLGWNGIANQPATVSCTAVAPATTCTLTGLATWSKYTVTVQAVGPQSSGNPTFVSLDSTKNGFTFGSTIWPQAPSQPLNILASNPSATSTAISWGTPTSVGGPAGVVISKYTAAMVPKFVPVLQTNKWNWSLYNGYTSSGAYGNPSPYSAGYGNSAFQLEALKGTSNLVGFTSWSCGTNPNKAKINAAASPSLFQGNRFDFYGSTYYYVGVDTNMQNGTLGTCYNLFNSKGFVYSYPVIDQLNNSSIVDQTKYTVGTVSWIHHEQWGYVFQVQAVRTSGTTGDLVDLITAYAPAYPATDSVNTTTGDIPDGPNFAAAIALKVQSIGDTPVSGSYSTRPAAAFSIGNTTGTVTDAHMLNANTVLMMTATTSTVGTPSSNVYASTLSGGTWTTSSTPALSLGCYYAPQSLCSDYATLKPTGATPLPIRNFSVNPVNGNLYFTVGMNSQNCGCCYNGQTNGGFPTYRVSLTGGSGTITYGVPVKLPITAVPQSYWCGGGFNTQATYQGYGGGSLINFDANGLMTSWGGTTQYSEDATAGFVAVPNTNLPLQSYDWWPTPTWLNGLGCRYYCGGGVSAPVRTPGGQVFAITARWSGDPRTPSTWGQTTSMLSVMLDPVTHTCTTTGALTCTVDGTVQGAAYGITVFATNKEPGGLTKDGPAGDFVNVVAGLPNSPTYVSSTLTSAGSQIYNSVVTFTPSKKVGGVIDTSITKYSCVMYDVSGTQVLPAPGSTIDTTAPAGATASTPLTCNFTGLNYGQMYYVAITATSPEGVSYPATAQIIVAGASAPVAGTYDQTQTPPVLTYTPTASGTTKTTFYTANPTVANGAIAATPATGVSCPDTGSGCTPTGLLPGTTYYALVCTKNALDTNADATTFGNLGNVTNGVPNNCVVEPFITPTDPAPDAAQVVTNSVDGGLILTWKTPNANGTTITGYSFSVNTSVYSNGSYIYRPVGGATGCTGLTAASTTCTFGGLTNGTQYTIFVYVNYTSKGRAYSATTLPQSLAASTTYGTPMVPLAAPTQAPTAVAGVGQATVSWQTLTPPAGYTIGAYSIVASPGTGLGCFTMTITDTSCVVTGLTNGTTYTFTLVASYINKNVNPPNGAFGNTEPSPASNPVTPQAVAPTAAPANVTATAGNGKATVSFDAVTADGGSAITSYVVTSSPDGKTCTATAPATTCDVTGLTNGTAYTFTVVAKNAKGSSPASSPSSPVTPQAVAPQPPTNVSLTIKSSTSLTAKWTAPTDNGGSPITGYTATATDGTNTFTCTATAPATTCDFTGLTQGTTYTVSVVATNVKGDSTPAAGASGVAPSAAPSTIAAPTATVGSTSATVTWTAPADNGAPITKYTVTSAPGGRTCTLSAPFPDPLQCTVTGLTIGTKYTFTVTATNGTGTSSPSSASNQITGASAPAGLAAPTVTAPANNNSNGQLTVNWKAPATPNGTVSQYVVTASPGGSTCTVSSPFTTLSCNVTGLTNGTAYTFKVVATNEIGDSAASPASASATPSTTPDAPTAVTPTAGVASVLVSWTAPANNGGANITKYTVTAYDASGTAIVPAKVCTTTGALSCTVTGLTNGTNYTFQVVATNVNGNSPSSDASVTSMPAPLPTAPTITSVTRSNQSAATITLTGVADPANAPVTGYTVTSAPGGKTCTILPTDSPLACEVTGLTPGTAYTFTAVANNRIGKSPNSKPSAAFTASTAPGAPGTPTAGVDPLNKLVDRQALVSWTAPANTGGLPIKGYVVTASPDGQTCAVLAPATKCIVKGLYNGTPYTFTVKAINDPSFTVANASTATNFVSDASAPSANFTPTWSNQVVAALTFNPPIKPTDGFTASTLYAMPVTITFSATPQASATTTYTVKLNGVTVNVTPTCNSTTNICTATWTPANKYILRTSDQITVVSSNGLTIGITPAAPKALAVAELHYGSGLSTVNPGSDEATFLTQIAQLIKDNGYTAVSFVGWTDADGSQAANLVLSQTRANNASTYLKAQLAALGVKGVTVTAVGKGISSEYTPANDPTAMAKNRRVMIQVSGQLAKPAVAAAPTVTVRNTDAVVSWTAPANNGVAITNYTVYYNTDADYQNNGVPVDVTTPGDWSSNLGNWAVFCTSTTTSCSAGTGVTLTNGTDYRFFVVATNSKGTANPGGVSAIDTPAVTVADAPTLVVAAGPTPKTSLTLTVTAPTYTGGSDVTTYTYTVLAGTVVKATGTLVAGTATTVTGLAAKTAYTVKVVATNAQGDSPAASVSKTTAK